MDTDVIVVGAGPVGLSAAIALGRLGVEVTVLERRATTSRHPKAHVENARTMEIFRLWGVEEEVRGESLPPAWLSGADFLTTLSGYELGAMRWDEDRDYMDRSATLSPAAFASAPQDRVEPILQRAAMSLDGVEVEFGQDVLGIEQDENGVTAQTEDGDGRRAELRARWAVVADGANSRIREAAGIPWAGPGLAGSQIGVYFHADLGPWTAERPYLLYWIYNPRLHAVLIALDGDRRWHLLLPYDAAKESVDDFTPERCARLIAEGVVGDPSCTIEVQSVLPWHMQIFTAESFREGRILLAGDAAHAMPPTGGLGLNSGVADAHNLAWKLAATIRGDAPESLLDTYGAERRPVALSNAAYSMRNAEKMAETGLAGILSHDPDALASIERPEGEEIRAKLSAAIPLQKEQFFIDGVTFGYCYSEGALVEDGTDPVASTPSDYRPTARPGARAPHHWLREGDRTVSTVDLSDRCLLLLAGSDGAAWRESASNVRPPAPFPLKASVVGEEGSPDADLVDPSGDWAQTYGLSSSGAVLIRPDGHVGWRCESLPSDPETELAAAVKALFAAPAQAPA